MSAAFKDRQKLYAPLSENRGDRGFQDRQQVEDIQV